MIIIMIIITTIYSWIMMSGDEYRLQEINLLFVAFVCCHSMPEYVMQCYNIHIMCM